MVEAQNWLDKNYPKEERSKVRLMSINKKDLEGELKLEDFSNLERIDCNENKLDSLQFTNCPKLTRVYCYGNKLTSLKITGCPKVSYLNISCNFFNNFDFLNDLDSKRLVYLSIHTNNLPESDLSIFSDFINLEELYIDNYDKDRFDKKIYNRFHGSLKPLKSLNKLRWLNVGGTDVDSGLEHLPLSLKRIGCSSGEMKGKCSTIESELREITKIAYVSEEATKAEGSDTNVSEEAIKVEESDTKWTKDWYKFAQWRQVREWEKKGFNRHDIRQWMNAGLKLDELDFAVYLKEKKYTPFAFKKETKIWLDWKYPKEERNNIKELNISHKNLSGELDLSNFANLRELDCSDNELTSLDLGKCSKLTLLNISNNDFSEQKDLKFLESFIKLESISLANNRFCGSLEPLKNMSNLRELNIVDTDINNGLEFLPSGLERFYCAGEQKINAKVKQIFEQLSNYGREGRYNLQAWEENNNTQAQKRLDKEYPEDDVCKRNSDKENKGKRREEIIILDISDQGLKGKLKLEGFDKLEKLNCSGNQLTNLDLSNCERLQRLNCSDNQFTSTNFLINLRKPNKLVKLDVGNNSKIFRQNLDFLTSFTGLEKLNLKNCPFKGSLKLLKNMTELRQINVGGTDIDDGLDELPEKCQKIYCNYDPQSRKRSIKIIKELGKHLEEADDYYNLSKWREEKRNGVASVIPLERLFVIRGNMKKFHDKWGEEGNNKEMRWWEVWKKLETIWEKKGNDNLSRLQSPEEYEKYWYAVIPQWTSRAAAVGGGILAINNDYNQIGGAIGIASTFFETAFSRVKEDLYDTKERRWEEFVRDTECLWDNFDELIGILKPLQTSSLREGKVNNALKDLNTKIYYFFEEYDSDRNGEIDTAELKAARSKITENLREKWERSGKEDDNSTTSIGSTSHNARDLLVDTSPIKIKEIVDSLDINDAKASTKNQIKKLVEVNALERIFLDNLWEGREDSWENYLEELSDKERIISFLRHFQKEKKEILEGIVEAIGNLQEEIVNYRKDFYSWTNKRGDDEGKKHQRDKQADQEQLLYTMVDMRSDNDEKEQIEENDDDLMAQIEVPPKN